jgi:hypothetical protein
MTPARYLLAWGLWLAALGLMLEIFSPGSVVPLLQLGAAAPVLALAAFAWRRPEQPQAARFVSDSSIGSVVLAIGIAVTLLGTTAGLWLALIGAEIVAVGIGVLARELLAMRRARRAAAEAGGG